MRLKNTLNTSVIMLHSNNWLITSPSRRRRISAIAGTTPMTSSTRDSVTSLDITHQYAPAECGETRQADKVKPTVGTRSTTIKTLATAHDDVFVRLLTIDVSRLSDLRPDWPARVRASGRHKTTIKLQQLATVVKAHRPSEATNMSDNLNRQKPGQFAESVNCKYVGVAPPLRTLVLRMHLLTYIHLHNTPDPYMSVKVSQQVRFHGIFIMGLNVKFHEVSLRSLIE